MSASRQGILYIFAAVIGYSFLPVFTEHLLNGGVEPLNIALWRYVLAAPIFWLLALARSDDRMALPRVRLILINGPLLAGAAVVAFFGLGMINAGTYSVIFYTYPAMVALLMFLAGERLSLWGWVAVALTLVGIALTAPDFSQGLSGDNLPGVLLALANALLVAVYFIFNSRLLRGRATTISSIIRVSAWTVSGALIFLVITALVMGFEVPQSGSAWANLVGMALVSTVMPVFALNMGLQKLGPTRAAIFGTIEPMTTALFALLFLGQVMQPIQWVGGLVIIASVVLLQTMGTPRRMRETAAAVGD